MQLNRKFVLSESLSLDMSVGDCDDQVGAEEKKAPRIEMKLFLIPLSAPFALAGCH